MKAGENDMTISAYSRLEQMRAEIEAAHQLATQTQARAEAAIETAHRLRELDETEDDVLDDVINRVNALIEQAVIT